MSDEKATEDEPQRESVVDIPDDESYGGLALRAGIGGVLMGLANLVPGISGGTMLLASGIYPRFIAAIAEVSTLKLKRRSLFTLGAVVVFALAAIVLFAGPMKTLVVEHRWAMFSLFIGLTLGGLPVVWKLAKPPTRSLWISAAIAALVMAGVGFMQMQEADAEPATGFLPMFLAGALAASAMILPGVSGSYLLMLLGAYVTILSGVDDVKNALKEGAWGDLTDPFVAVVLPVGLGVVIGVVVVSNALKWLLERYEKPTLGALLGFLAGAPVGLWPFREGIAPALGSTHRGRVITEETLAELDPSKYPTEWFTPSAAQVGMSLGLVVAGFGITALVAKLGAGKEEAKPEGEAQAA